MFVGGGHVGQNPFCEEEEEEEEDEDVLGAPGQDGHDPEPLAGRTSAFEYTEGAATITGVQLIESAERSPIATVMPLTLFFVVTTR